MPREVTCQVDDMKQASTVYQFQSIWRSESQSTQKLIDVFGLCHTEILHAFEEPPPMSMPDMLILEVAALEGAVVVVDILATIVIVPESMILRS